MTEVLHGRSERGLLPININKVNTAKNPYGTHRVHISEAVLQQLKSNAVIPQEKFYFIGNERNISEEWAKLQEAKKFAKEGNEDAQKKRSEMLADAGLLLAVTNHLRWEGVLPSADDLMKKDPIQTAMNPIDKNDRDELASLLPIVVQAALENIYGITSFEGFDSNRTAGRAYLASIKKG